MSEIDFQKAELTKGDVEGRADRRRKAGVDTWDPAGRGMHAFATDGYVPPPRALGRRETFGLTVHPLAALMPFMTGAEFRALVESIRKNGQREPLLVLKGKILDGRNRFRAIQALHFHDETFTPKTVEYDGPTDTASLWSLVLSRNLYRRHLTTGQRAILAAQCLPSFQKPARAPSRPGAIMRSPNEKARKASDAAAAAFGVSARTVEKAAHLLKVDPVRARAVQNGTTKLDAALKQAEGNKTKGPMTDAQVWRGVVVAAEALVACLLELKDRGARVTEGLTLARHLSGFVRRVKPTPDEAPPNAKAKKKRTLSDGREPVHGATPALKRPGGRVTWAHDARNAAPKKRSA